VDYSDKENTMLQGLGRLQQFLATRPPRQRPISGLEAIGRGLARGVPQAVQQAEQMEAFRGQQIARAIESGTGAKANPREVSMLAQRLMGQAGGTKKYLTKRQQELQGQFEGIKNMLESPEFTGKLDAEKQAQKENLQDMLKRVESGIGDLQVAEKGGLKGLFETRRIAKQGALQEAASIFDRGALARQAPMAKPLTAGQIQQQSQFESRTLRSQIRTLIMAKKGKSGFRFEDLTPEEKDEIMRETDKLATYIGKSPKTKKIYKNGQFLMWDLGLPPKLTAELKTEPAEKFVRDILPKLPIEKSETVTKEQVKINKKIISSIDKMKDAEDKGNSDKADEYFTEAYNLWINSSKRKEEIREMKNIIDTLYPSKEYRIYLYPKMGVPLPEELKFAD